jgi:hypothetical protein
MVATVYHTLYDMSSTFRSSLAFASDSVPSMITTPSPSSRHATFKLLKIDSASHGSDPTQSAVRRPRPLLHDWRFSEIAVDWIMSPRSDRKRIWFISVLPLAFCCSRVRWEAASCAHVESSRSLAYLLHSSFRLQLARDDTSGIIVCVMQMP